MGDNNTPSPGMVDYVANAALDPQLTAQFIEATDSEATLELAKQLVNRTIVAYQSVFDGEALGTTRMSPQGDVAKRVDVDGVIKWRVIYANGAIGFDLRPSLPDWTLIPLPGE